MACLQRFISTCSVVYRYANTRCFVQQKKNYSLKGVEMGVPNSLETNFKLQEKKSEIKNPNNMSTSDDFSPLKYSSNKTDFKKVVEMTTTLNDLKKIIEETSLSKENAVFICNKIIFRHSFQSDGKMRELKDFAKTRAAYKLFSVLDKYQHTLTPDEIVKVFQLSVLLNIPQTSLMVQKTVILLLENINMFLPIDVLNVYDYCEKIKHKTKLLEALNSACLKYMNHCFEDKLLVKFLPTAYSHFIGKPSTPKHIKECLIKSLVVNGVHSFTPQMYEDIFNGCKKTTSNFTSELDIDDSILTTINEGLKNSLNNSWTARELFCVFNAYSSSYLSTSDFYDGEIYDKFAMKAIKEKMELKNAIEMMTSMCEEFHFNPALNEYIFSQWKALENESLCLFPSFALSFLKIVVMTDFYGLDNGTQISLINQFESHFSEFEITEELKSDFAERNFLTALSATLSLAALGIYRKAVVNRVVDMVIERFSQGSSDDVGFYAACHILWLHHWLSLFHPEHENKLPNNVVDDCYLKIIQTEKLMSSSAVESLNQNFVLRNCVTPLNLPLHYVVVLGENNKFVDLFHYKSLGRVSISDLRLPEKCQIVVLQETKPQLAGYFRNISLPSKKLTLFSKILQRFGCDVIFLDSLCFHSTSENDCIALLTQKLKEKYVNIDLNIIKQ